MELISHRGNLLGPNRSRENTPAFIDDAIALGFDVEVDLWILPDGFFLGHDQPDTKIDLDYINTRSENLFIHIKNKTIYLPDELTKCNYFVHENEPFVFTSKGNKWYLPSDIIYNDGINLMPEFNWNLADFASTMTHDSKVCSDFICTIKNFLNT